MTGAAAQPRRPSSRTALASIDSGIPLDEVRTGSMLVAQDTAGRRFDWLVVLVFAGVGLSLAAIGTYGSLSALVLGRRAEIGARRALGATAPSVVGRVLRHTLFLTDAITTAPSGRPLIASQQHPSSASPSHNLPVTTENPR